MISKAITTVVIAIAIFIVSIISATERQDNERAMQFDGNIRNAMSELLYSQPKAQFTRSGAAVNCVYGTTLETGSSPEHTAENFIGKYTNVFGANYDELTPGSRSDNQPRTQPVMYDEFTDSYKFTQVYYHQSVDGIPVFRSELRLLVRNQSNYPLVLAKSSLHDLRRYAGGGARAMSSADIAPIVRADDMYLDEISEPETVIWAGLRADTTTPRAAVTVLASNDDGALWLYVIDTRTREILYKEDQIIFAQVQGEVSGLASDYSGADICQEERPAPLPYALVEAGGLPFYTDSLGHYDADVNIPMITEVTSGLKGRHFSVHNAMGDDVLIRETTSGGELNFVHNETNDDPLYRSQVNAYVCANRVRDFVLRQNPDYPLVSTDRCVDIYTNRTDMYCPCNAWYNPYDVTLNFCKSAYGWATGDTCANTAFSTVIFHEYGHHLVQAGGSGQWQYGEGMADAISLLMTEDPRLGIGLLGDCNEYLRSADNEMQFPCSFIDGACHYCGQVLSGAIWDVRNELMLTYPSSYNDTLARLTVNSILLHDGDLITPQIVIDFLTLDDDDADIINGTPHMLEICAGFSAHNLRCPEFHIFEFAYSEEFPEFTSADSAYSIQVEIIPNGSNTIVPGSGVFHFAVNSFDYQQGEMTEIGDNIYNITFPEVSCGDIVNFYTTAESVEFGTIADPYYYDTDPHKIIIAKDRITILADDFNTDKGWSIEVVNNIGGNWQRGIPIPEEADHGAPPTDYDGSGLCYLTDNTLDISALRHGTSSLISPNLGALDGVARIEYSRWWNNMCASIFEFADDSFRVQVSGDNGNTWVSAKQIDPNYSDHLGGWFQGSVVPDDFVISTTGTKIRFDAMNDGRYPLNLVEAAIDDIKIYMYVCYDGLTIVTQILPQATLGAAYSAPLEAIYGTGEVSWSDKFDDLSSNGFSLSPEGIISGIPEHVENITFTALATDSSGQSAEKPFTISVNSGLKFLDNFADEWTFGCSYREHFKVEGGTPQYAFTNPSGNLETEHTYLGLMIEYFEDWDEDGVSRDDWGLTGKFLYEDSVWFTLAVTDQAGATDTIAVTIFTNDSLKLSTVTLPDAIAGVPYSAQIEYTGGTHPIKWYDSFRDIMNLGLWLDTLTGEVSGIPDSIGTFELRINVCDTAGCYWRFENNWLIGLTIEPQDKCGDFDLNGAIDITDLTFLIDYMFSDGPAPNPFEAADVNNSGQVDISDVTFMAEYLFAGGDYPHCPEIPE